MDTIFLKKRKEMELTQVEISKLLGVSTNTWIGWEKGCYFPNYKSVKIIREVLKLDI